MRPVVADVDLADLGDDGFRETFGLLAQQRRQGVHAEVPGLLRWLQPDRGGELTRFEDEREQRPVVLPGGPAGPASDLPSGAVLGQADVLLVRALGAENLKVAREVAEHVLVEAARAFQVGEVVGLRDRLVEIDDRQREGRVQ